MKIVFMGTPDFSVPTLRKLKDNGYEISLAITQPDKPKGRGKKLKSPPVKIEAEKLGIDVYQPKNVNNKQSIKLLKEINPDVIVVIAYGQILKEDILNIPKYGCLNVHASLLPKYRGAAPINWAIINGENKTGITIMQMDKGLDTGDMLKKKEVTILENENAGQLHDRLMHIGAELLVETLEKIEKNQIERKIQNEEEATYAPMMDKNLGKIDWTKTSEEIKNLVRGTKPWPGSYFIYKDKKVKVKDVEISKKYNDPQPGKVLKVLDKGIFISTAEGSIVIKKLQFPGKKAMEVSEYLKGNSFEDSILLK